MMQRISLCAAVAVLVSLAGCGGGSAGSTGSTGGAPAVQLALSSAATTTSGTTPVVLTATHGAADQVSWQLASGSPGALSASSGDTVSYLPPLPGTVTAATTVSVTATAGGQSRQISLTVQPTAPGVYLVAGTESPTGNVDGKGGGARLWNGGACGIAVDSQGAAYLPEAYNQVLRRVLPDGTTSTVAGKLHDYNSSTVDSNFAGSAMATAVDEHDNIYVAAGNQIQRVTPLGMTTTMIASAGYGLRDGAPGTASFSYVRAIARDGSGNLWIADQHAIRRIGPDMTVVTIAGGTSAGSSDGSGTAASLRTPCGLAVDASGNVLVADTGNHTIRLITPAGMVSTLAGAAGTKGSTDGDGASARFAAPTGIALLGGGRAVVTDSGNGTVRLLSGIGSGSITVSTLAGSPGAVQEQRDGQGSAARFYQPRGVAVAPTGEVLVADHAALRVVKLDGTVTTRAGLLRQAGTSDGVGGMARFGDMTWAGGMALDAAGDLILADPQGHTIRKLDRNGVVTTIAGTPGVAGDADGPHGTARFNDPRGVAIDASGNIYVSDYGNGSLRRIARDGSVSTPVRQLARPEGLAFDDHGNLYVIERPDNSNYAVSVLRSDGSYSLGPTREGYAEALVFDAATGSFLVGNMGNGVLDRYTPGSGYQSILGLDGQPGSIDSSVGWQVSLEPLGLTFGANGEGYVTNLTSRTIRRIALNGATGTVAGTPFQYGGGIAGVLPELAGLVWTGNKTLVFTSDTGVYALVLP
jgi:sugar lactone lactonase YvrE